MPSNSNTSFRSDYLPGPSRGVGIAALLMVVWLFLGLGKSFGQSNYQINSVNGQTISTTSGNFYDSGGSGSTYSNNETYTVTFNSGTSDKIQFAFSSFSTESGFDFLYVYDGPSTSSAQVSGSPFNGTTSPGTITSSSNSLTFKFVSDTSVTSTGWAAAISTIAASDYGDYSGFASASATASTNLYMGTNLTDVETSGLANSTATGDNNNGTNDEDLTQPSMKAGTTATLTIPVFNNTGSTAYLSVWIDFNNNGVLTDSGEAVISSLPVSSSSTKQNLTPSITIPSTATPGSALGMRYRLDSTSGVSSTGIGGIGEVEDYLVTISCPTITVTPSSLTAATMATSYSQATAFAASGGNSPYTWSATGVPTGMTFNTSTLKLTGTPLFTGTSSVVVTATDAKGCTGSVTVSFQVCSPPSLKPDSLPAATVGSAYSSTLTATEAGFDMQQAFSSSSGSITNLATADALLSGTSRASNWTGAGAVVNFMSSGGGDGHYVSTVFPAGAGDDFALRATGTITIPTAGSWTFGINSDDGCRLKIDGTAIITTDAQRSAADTLGIVTLTAGTHTIEAEFFERAGGESFELWAGAGSLGSWSSGSFNLIGSSTGLAVVRSSPTYTWTVSSGTLPTGLSLSSGGVLSGTPSVAGTYNFTIAATDANSCVGTKSYSITASCPTLTMTPATGALTVGTVGSAYSQTMSSSGSFGTLTWSVSSGTLPAGLAINSSTGAITGTPTAATSGTTGTSISIKAQDQYGCSVTLAYTLKICPVLGFSPSTLPVPTVGTAYSQTITASNGTSPYTYTVSTGTLPAGLSLSSAGVLSGTPTSTTSKTFTVQATDANLCTGTISYTVAPVCPAVTITPATMATGTVGSAYSQTLSASGATAPYTWTLQSGTLPAGLSLGSSTGIISGTPTASNGAGTALTFAAADVYGCSGTLGYTLKICPVITVTPVSLATGTVGTAYSASMSSSGGATPYTYAVSSGTLPAGLSLSTAGVISGTPTASNGTGTSFTITATDANGCPGVVTSALKICPVITVTPASLANGTVGTAYSATMTASGGASPYNYTVTSGTLPAGLTLANSTGVISGMPTTSNGAGVSFSITATDANGCPGVVTSALKICPVITVTPASLANGTVGTAYSATMTASGGASPYNYAVTSGTLPAGLSLASSTGVISGTPTTSNGAGVSITITATDANGCPGTVTDTLQICPVVTVSPASLPVPTVGTAYSQTITASNGTGPYAYAVSSGTLPAGLSLSSAGVLSGTPTSTTSQTFTVRALDSNGCPGTLAYTVAPVCPTLTFTPASLPTGTVGTGYLQTLVAKSGTSPYSWTVSSGTLPSGLSLSSSGVISGTPTATNGAGASITFRATDTYGCTNTVTYSLKICPVISLSPASLAGATVGTAYSQTLSASGGVTPYTFAITSGTLPVGLTLSSSGVLGGTPTSTTSRTFTVQALDVNGCAGTLSYTLAPVCPTISPTPATIVSGTVGTAYSQTLSASGGNSPYTWTLQTGTLPAGLALSSAGVISGTPTASNAAGTSLTFKATDNYGCSATITYTLKICPVLTLGPATLPQGTVGSAYSSSITASGGASPYAFTVSAGTIPAGLTFTGSTGQISGTPTASNGAGTVITFTAADANNCPGTFNSTIQICPVIALAPATFSTPVVGTAFSQTVTASNGASPYAYSVTSGTLPAGLSLSSAGVLSGTATSTASQTFVITAVDANGCPAIKSYTVTPVCPTVTIAPPTIPNGTVGTAYSQALTASPGNPPYTWAVQTGTLPAGLALSSAGVISGTPTTSNAAGTSLTFAATDIYGCVVTSTYNLKICPIITLSPAVLPFGTVGTSYSSSVTQSGGATPATFAVTGGTLPAGLSLTGSSGLISGTPTTSNGPGVTVTFSATDANGCPGTMDSLFKICPVISISPATASTPVVGFAYSQTLISSNGAAPYTYSVISGTLPAGLTLSSSGVLSGIATSTATQVFTVQTVDVNGCPATKSYTITPVCPTVLVAPTTVPYGTVGTPYSQALSASGGTAPYTFSVQSGTLPAGLTLSADGTISGTPTTSNGAGVVLQFKATDVYGCPGTFNSSGTSIYTLKICPVISITPASPLPTATLHVPYTQTLTASGGAGTYTWSVVSGSLPTGMTMSSAGVISGTPTVVASFNFTVQALDANSCPGTLGYTLPVQCPPIAVSPATLADGTLGIGYSQTLTASGGIAPYTWAVTGGTLPAGLTLSSGGVISGTPTATNGAGVSVTFSGTDSDFNGCAGVKTYTMKMCPVVQVSPATLPPLTVGAVYSQAVSASGGAGPYTFSVFNGTLPSWASLDPVTGIISGTPTNTTQSTFVIKATDINGCPGLRSYTVAPSCPVISVSPSSLAVPTVGTAYSTTVAAGGGSAPYTFTVTSGALPSWATLNTSTGVISGLPNSTTPATFTIAAADAYSCTGTHSYTLSPVCPSISVSPSTLTTGTVGTAYSAVAAASGGTAPYSYAITSGTLPAGLSLSSATGQISGNPTAPTTGTTGMALIVRATDNFGCQGSQVVNLKICPVITLTPATLPAGTVGTAYSQAVTASGGASPYSYAITSGSLPAGLSMSTGGAISGTPTTAVSANITITATDANGCPGSLAYTLAVSCPVITISPGTLALGTQGTVYAGSLSASGGTAPYTWTVASGTLPSGITMTSAGVLGGTPTVSNGAGVSITFQASDNYGCLATKSYTFKICPVISFLPSTLPSGTVGVAYNQTLSALNGAPPITFSLISGALPGGLTLNGSTGVISGTPTTGNGVGTNVTFQATDANSCPGTKGYTLKICPLITLSPGSVSSPTVGTAYSQTISASGGASPYAFSVTGGGLPAWASLNTSTGVISGTPNTTTGASFTITAIDVNGCPGTQTYNFTPACPTITIFPGVLPVGTVGVAYSQALSALGGSSPYTWALASGTLPPGLSLSSNGLISGTPTASNGVGVSITVRATDSLGCVMTRALTVKICPVISVSPGTLTPFVIGTPYSQTFSASGGTAPYTFAVTAGALPSWAALNTTTGVLSGTPTNGTQATFSITASDANGCAGVSSYTLVLLSLKVGNLVWSDTNNNGIKDPGENGISNIRLELWSAGPNGIEENGGGDDVKIAADVVTDTNGGYLFAGVPAGSNYYVRIPVLPPTNAVTSGTPVALDNGVDNDNNGLQPGGPGTPIRSPLFAIAAGAEPDVAVDGDDTNGNLTIDFGLAPTISVGNLVFKDVDNSGTFDATIDAPLDGVTLQLFAQGADPLASTPVATTVSSGGGLYLFSVRAGNYFVYVPASQFASTGVLYGMKPARGRTDNTVPNIDDNGDQNALATSKPIATGVRTGVFSLASGVMATATSGETGYHSTDDDGYDSNSNLTVDLGFYPLPTVTAPLAGRVKRDLTGAGDPTAATAPLPGVEVSLYEDLNGNGKLDPEEMTAVATTVTSSTGAYSFDAVPAGDYFVVQTILPGAEATFDSDGGDADITAITVEGDPIVDVNFLQALSPDTFSQWQQLHPGISNGALDNPDGDLASNLLEYALGTEAASGTDKRHFWLQSNAQGSVDAVLVRYATGHKDVVYALEGSNDLASWTSITTAPVTVQGVNGMETLVYADMTFAFVRLKVGLDANLDGVLEATATTPVQGWTRHTFAPGSQTFSMPLLKPEVFAGASNAATGAGFITGKQYYAEVIGGESEGLRFEVNEAKSSSSSIAYEAASPTVDARIVVRPHWMVRDLFPETLFQAGSASSGADRVMFFNGTGYNVLWLMARPGGNRWVRDGDATLADAGTTVVGPLEGLMVNRRGLAVNVTYTGSVRAWKVGHPLHSGAQLMGSGYPLALSPNDRAMNGSNGFAASDSFRLWLGDSSASATYAAYTFQLTAGLGSLWTADDGHDVSAIKLFDAYRAAWIISGAGGVEWSSPLPWSP